MSRLSPEVRGEPIKCGMCGKGMIPGLLFRGKMARQAMSPSGSGRIHIDRELCRELAKKSEEDIRGRVAFVPKDDGGSGGVVGPSEHSHPVEPVGPDRGNDGQVK